MEVKIEWETDSFSARIEDDGLSEKQMSDRDDGGETAESLPWEENGDNEGGRGSQERVTGDEANDGRSGGKRRSKRREKGKRKYAGRERMRKREKKNGVMKAEARVKSCFCYR